MPEALLPSLRELATQAPDAVAVVRADAERLTRREFIECIDTLAETLEQCGVREGDAVAVVVGDNLAFGIEFLAAVRGSFCVVPFNALTPPGTLAAEAARSGCSHIIVPEKWPARDKAAKLFADGGLGVMTQVCAPTTTLGFTLRRDTPSPSQRKNIDATLMLRTSGTTGDPKLVPLNAPHLEQSARAVIDSLALTDDDHGICLMPLLHVHGLVSCFLAPLLSGGSIKVLDFMDVATLATDLEAGETTWFSAVPTVHMTLMTRFADHLSDSVGKSLRFVRSASAPLPEPVREYFVDRLGTEVVEAYGMTEAAHQISSQRVGEPAPAGSVGRVDNQRVQLLGENGLQSDGTGEVVLNLGDYFSGYLSGASDDHFHDGWFRTGDVGEIDDSGFLTLVGRIKEMINRGGETIAPRDIESAALACQGIDSACAFAIPDDTYGETVGLAVTAGGEAPDEKALRREMFSHLAPPMMPQKIMFLEEFPTGATGKIDRRALAQMLTPA